MKPADVEAFAKELLSNFYAEAMVRATYRSTVELISLTSSQCRSVMATSPRRFVPLAALSLRIRLQKLRQTLFQTLYDLVNMAEEVLDYTRLPRDAIKRSCSRIIPESRSCQLMTAVVIVDIRSAR